MTRGHGLNALERGTKRLSPADGNAIPRIHARKIGGGAQSSQHLRPELTENTPPDVACPRFINAPPSAGKHH